MILPRCLLLCSVHASACWLPAHVVDAHAGTHLDVFTIELYHGLLQRLHQTIVGITSHKNVVGSDAHLPAVQKLALQRQYCTAMSGCAAAQRTALGTYSPDASRDNSEIAVRVVHNARRLATELERHRRQMLRRGRHDNAADSTVPCADRLRVRASHFASSRPNT